MSWLTIRVTYLLHVINEIYLNLVKRLTRHIINVFLFKMCIRAGGETNISILESTKTFPLPIFSKILAKL